MSEQQEPVAIGFDIETASADKLYAGGHAGPFVRLAGFTDGVCHHAPTPSAELLESLADADHIYGHNIFRFDIPALARHAGADYDALCAKAWDTAVLARLVDPPGAKGMNAKDYYSLDSVAKRYGHTGKSDDLGALALEFGPEKVKGGLSPAERKAEGYEMIPVDEPRYRDYLRGDLEATAFVRREVFSRITNWPYARREMKVAALQNRMTFNGWRIDPVVLRERVEREDERRLHAVQKLTQDYDLPTTKKDGKPSAAPWATEGGRLALEAAFKEAGAEYLPRTKTGALAIGKNEMGADYWVNPEGKRVPGMMNPLAYGNLPGVAALCAVLAEATGATAKYAEIERYVTNQGRVHGGIGEDQASGRWAMTKPSLTNLGKRGDKVEQRAPFLPEWGHVHIACDASQVDLRAVAAECQDPAYMALFAPGRDAHMDMAEVYFGERTKEARGKTKAINHKVNYGGAAESTAAMNGLPVQLVRNALAERARAYPRLIEWSEEVRAMARRGELLDNGFGRLMRCDPERAHTQSVALVGQGAARDLVCQALLRLAERYPVVTAYLRGFVHDEVILSVPEHEASLWQERLREAFTFTWKDVPILCDVSAPGLNWAACYDGE